MEEDRRGRKRMREEAREIKNTGKILRPFPCVIIGGNVDYSSKPLGLFFCQFQLSRHISSIPNSAFQPSSASAFAGLQ